MKQNNLLATLALTALTTLSSLTTQAQTYQWQWAKNGGGVNNVYGEYPGWYYADVEQILDIKTDADNNYYFLARATNGNTQIDGNPITTYNTPSRYDIVIFSTTCEGTYRWSRVIGGGMNDAAYNIEVDANGGVLVLVRVGNYTGNSNNFAQTHFSEDDMLPAPPIGNGVDDFTYHDAYRKGFLLRYNSANGDLVWRKNIQTSAPSIVTSDFLPTQIQLDSNGMIHVILLLQEGTHLNGTVSIPTGQIKYYLAKFNALTGNLAAPAVELPITGVTADIASHFRYDEHLNRYYISSTRDPFFQGVFPFSYNGIPMEKASFVLALDGATYNELWRIETYTNSNTQYCTINELQIDAQSNIYVSGEYSNSNLPEETGVFIGNHQISNDAVIGNSVYVAKLNPQGQVLWSKTPDANLHSTFAEPRLKGIAFNGDQVVIAGSGDQQDWGGFVIDNPFGHQNDPFLLHLNKETGATVGLNPVLGSFGAEHGFTKVAVDNDGNYVVGGYTHGNLFSADDDNVPTLYIQSSSYTDFLYAKFAATPCGTQVSSTKHNKLHLNVYPNPTHDILNIQTDEVLQSYQVYNMLGQEVSKGSFTSSNATLSVAKLASGTYVVKVKTQNNTEATFKVVKK